METTTPSFTEQIRALEAELIRRAITEHGTVTSAARALGFAHHQSLISKLNTCHPTLRAELNVQPRHRRRSIINVPQRQRGSSPCVSKGVRDQHHLFAGDSTDERCHVCNKPFAHETHWRELRGASNWRRGIV